jgi:DNA-binding transcriptional ArsR family regulator
MPTIHESLDSLDSMVTNHASTPEIRSQIAYIGREVSALEAQLVSLADDNAVLQTENADLIAKNAELVQKNRAVTAELENKRLQEAVNEQGRQVLECLFRETMTAQEIAEAIGSPQGATDYHIELLRQAGLVESIRFTGEQRRLDFSSSDWGFAITQKGRQWIVENPA